MRRPRDRPIFCNPMPPAARLRELLRYEEDSGVLYWRVGRGPRNAGDVAGCPDTDGRRRVMIDGRLYQAARVAWKLKTGREPRGVIDHRNLDNADDRWYNLRDLTPRENSTNQRMRSTNTSGYRGVSYVEKTNKFRASIMHRGKSYHLGLYLTAERAAAAYEAMALVYHRGPIL